MNRGDKLSPLFIRQSQPVGEKYRRLTNGREKSINTRTYVLRFPCLVLAISFLNLVTSSSITDFSKFFRLVLR